ncbi:hypothetical protein [Sphingobacterium yanglingense]|uniref:Transmembrane protein n=1 Tax=Sphingobacterium yanglingense TaxID=1437280 RepID=A0A4R6W942_9SPHI|nr:hypothetical protein [Sphingobacterium yanglingense]TDQ73932.1 hypothetical protein CLV99_4370 [Sphingobacterium yanglingense]
MREIIGTIRTSDFAFKLFVFLPILLVCYIAGSVDMGPFWIPVLFGLFVGLIFMDRLRFKILLLVLPVVFFLIFITIGGLAFLAPFISFSENSFGQDGLLVRLLRSTSGMWCAWVILGTIKLFFKVKMKFEYFIIAAILVSPPYLLNLSPDKEPTSGLFYLLWNFGISFVICLMFSENRSGKNTRTFMNVLRGLD